MSIFQLIIKTAATVLVILNWWFEIKFINKRCNHWYFKAYVTLEAIDWLISIWVF